MPDQAPPITVDGVRQQFQEQIAFFRQKLNLPTETWRDIQRAAHDRAFVVAGAMKADLLADLRRAVDGAIQGSGIQAFRKDFDAIVIRHGWTGWTGQGSKAGEAWRTRVIYQANIASSYAAGRRQQLLDPDLLARRPFWRYVHNDSAVTPRPQHKQWGDARLTLRHDHPFWQTHFPPNGWGCKCRIVAAAAPKDGDATEPPEGWDERLPATDAPAGIDEGWDYAPGANVGADLRTMVQDKLIDYPPAISKALSAEVKRVINAAEAAPDFVRGVLEDRKRVEDLWLGFVENPGPVGRLAGVDVDGFTALLPAQTARHADMGHRFDGGDQRPIEPDDYAHIERVLNTPDSTRPSDDTGPNGEKRLVFTKLIGTETFHAVFEVRPGKRNRALALVSLWIKTGGRST